MPDTKITALTAIGANPIIPATFPIPMVDLTDTSMAASGTTKKVTVNQILGAGGTATLASATITGDLTVDTSTLKVDAANNRVGVGTATPRASFALDVLGNVALGNSTTTTSNRLKLDCAGTAGNVAVMSFAAAGTTKAFYGLSGGFLGDTSTDAIVATDAAGAAIRFFVSDTGTEAMRLNSTGLGVGVSPTGYGILALKKDNTSSPPYIVLDNRGTGASDTNTYTQGGILFGAYRDVSNPAYIASITVERKSAAGGASSTGDLIFGTAATPTTGAATERMRIDSSGRLLVGSSASGTAAGDGVVKLGAYGHCISQTGTSIASGSSIDLTVVTSGAGYQGFLSVANTQDVSANTRTQTTYSVFGRGAASTITQIATANGSIGGASFTVTTPSNGVIRITNTSGLAATISAQFFGGASA